MIKSLWKIASTIATIITIKNQLQALSNAPKELSDLSKSLPSGWSDSLPPAVSAPINSIVAGDTSYLNKFQSTVVLPQTASQLQSLKAGI